MLKRQALLVLNDLYIPWNDIMAPGWYKDIKWNDNKDLKDVRQQWRKRSMSQWLFSWDRDPGREDHDNRYDEDGGGDDDEDDGDIVDDDEGKYNNNDKDIDHIE